MFLGIKHLVLRYIQQTYKNLLYDLNSSNGCKVCEYMQRIEFIVNDYTRMHESPTEDATAGCRFCSAHWFNLIHPYPNTRQRKVI